MLTERDNKRIVLGSPRTGLVALFAAAIALSTSGAMAQATAWSNNKSRIRNPRIGQAVWSGSGYTPRLLTSRSRITSPRNSTVFQFLGTLSSNRYASDSISNSYGTYGSPYSSVSINNPYGRYGSPYSSYSVNNPYATNAPRLYGVDGTYLGRLSRNRYAPDSISNPYGRYGSPYSSKSINNPYGRFGSRYSSTSPFNRYATNPPRVYGE